MKVVLIFLAVISFSCGKSLPVRNLQDDLQDFLALIPKDEILAIAMDYLANDAEVQAAVEYLKSDDFETIVVTIDNLPEFQNFLNFLQTNGLNAIDFLNNIHDLLGIPHIPVAARKHLRRGVGITGLIDDIIAILPVDDLYALFQEKLETSAEFKALYDAIRSPEFQGIVETLKALPEYQDLIQKLKDKGVDVDHIIELIHQIFNIVRDTRGLPEDLQDFLALIPTDQVLAIAADYLANDAEVKAAVEYLKSDEFETIVVTVDSLPETKNFLNFLQSNGLNAIEFLNNIHDLLGIPHIPVTARKHHRRGVGITGLIDDIIAILPVDDLYALFQEKLETSPEFKALYDAIRSPEFQSIVGTLEAMPEYQNLIQKLKDKGVDVDHIIELIHQIFNIVRDTRGLPEDLQDFLALIPTDQVLAIAADYLANDAEVKAAVEYLKSDEFETIVVTVDSLPEFKNFLNFLQTNGLNAIEFLNNIHDLLGIPHIPVTARKHLRRGVGITGLIDDIIAILPVDDLYALFQEKLETSPEFKALYDAIRSPEFQSIVETLKAMPEYQSLIQKLKDKGVDVDHIIELIHQIFNIVRDTRGLPEDLQDFLALIPIDQILAIAADYLANDAEVQAAVEYLKSDEFETIVVTVDSLPEFKNFLNFLQTNGLNAIEFINNIHDLLGIPHIPATGRKHVRRGVGINGLIDDVIAILPVDELYALFQEKLESSPEFKALYDAIRSPEFQSIVQTLKAMPEYQDLIQRLKDKGVDVDHFIELIKKLFGLSH